MTVLLLATMIHLASNCATAKLREADLKNRCAAEVRRCRDGDRSIGATCSDAEKTEVVNLCNDATRAELVRKTACQ